MNESEKILYAKESGMSVDDINAHLDKFSNGGSIIYDMMYQMNRGKLFVAIGEASVDESYEKFMRDTNHVLVSYCSSEELYVFLRDETNSGAIVQEDTEYVFE